MKQLNRGKRTTGHWEYHCLRFGYSGNHNLFTWFTAVQGASGSAFKFNLCLYKSTCQIGYFIKKLNLRLKIQLFQIFNYSPLNYQNPKGGWAMGKSIFAFIFVAVFAFSTVGIGMFNVINCYIPYVLYKYIHVQYFFYKIQYSNKM